MPENFRVNVEDIMAMPSINKWGTHTVEDWVTRYADDILTRPSYQDLVEDTRNRGINRDPIHIGPAVMVFGEYLSTSIVPELVRASDRMLGNGHHRLAALYYLGIKEALCTDDYDTSYKWRSND
ncbi:MAG: hypothetical protein ACREHG_00095 [Candidatus Saccharimonadales bacterium]